MELYRDHFQNYRRYGIPKAQLIIADIPYNLADKAFASNPQWYKDGDNANGVSIHAPARGATTMAMFDRPFIRKSIPTKCKHEVIARDKLHCVQCGKELFLDQTKKQLSVIEGEFHHILPLVYGGENRTFNICLLCRSCHIKIHSGREIKQKYFIALENWFKTGSLGAGDK